MRRKSQWELRIGIPRERNQTVLIGPWVQGRWDQHRPCTAFRVDVLPPSPRYVFPLQFSCTVAERMNECTFRIKIPNLKETIPQTV